MYQHLLACPICFAGRGDLEPMQQVPCGGYACKACAERCQAAGLAWRPWSPEELNALGEAIVFSTAHYAIVDRANGWPLGLATPDGTLRRIISTWLDRERPDWRQEAGL